MDTCNRKLRKQRFSFNLLEHCDVLPCLLYVLWFLTGWRREQLGEGLLHGRSRARWQCRRCRQEGGGDLWRPSGQSLVLILINGDNLFNMMIMIRLEWWYHSVIKNYDYGDINILHALILLFTGFPAHPLTGGWHWVGVWNPAYDKAWLSLCWWKDLWRCDHVH